MSPRSADSSTSAQTSSRAITGWIFRKSTPSACKARAGDDFTVWARIDAKEFRTEGGIELEHSERTAELLEAAGAAATLVRIDLPGNASGEGMEQLTRLMSRVAVFEERDEGQFAALLEGTDPKGFAADIAKI